ncbi:unknown protein [Paenibacillus amylolyticus]|uniref:Uncharacterized protein n=1 Tax=Paenibacillus amylolyticus TaxID=1451 RepID=A0A100VT66_PAEAM|nr:unknown protein [Paenibacillus amylolyticus]
MTPFLIIDNAVGTRASGFIFFEFLHRHSDDRITLRSLLSPDFLIPIVRRENPVINGKHMLPMQLSFRKLLASLLQVISVLSVIV